MKKLAFVLPVLFAIAAVGLQTNANAGETAAQKAVSPQVMTNQNILKVSFTWVKGTIKVPSVVGNPQLSAMTCNDLHVIANSEEVTTRPPGYTGFFVPSPKWSRSAPATGNYASGQCSYAITVIANSNFNVQVSEWGTTNLPCQWIDMTSSPAQSGWIKEAVGATRTQDFALSNLGCGILH